MFENRNRARYLAGPEHHCVVRGDLEGEGDQELLQKELDLTRKQEAQCDVTGTASGYREGDEEKRVRFGFGRQGRGASKAKGQARSELRPDALGRAQAQGANKSSSE